MSLRWKPAAVALLVAGVTAVVAPTSVAARPPAGLTQSGRLLWNLEALLRQTFGSSYRGCIEYLTRYTPAFTVDTYCETHSEAETMGYMFTFTGAYHSAFHLDAHTFAAGAFGNYPQLIRIQHDYVACDPGDHTFLIGYGDVYGLSANLACLSPNH